uniref:ATP synthase F0 subunit 6 n=1 Tax=Coleonyx mitratus TaxID=449391 RepID=UPI002551D383|nr:ATP synthase F0 subunit 6 [Coleonyx mitratus]WGC93720.1 ATP synthase F0 subunit 6 [Coleonyx mitratus]
MMLNLFDQFATPHILGIPLMLIALLTPIILLSTNNPLKPNRSMIIQTWFMKTFIKQLMMPLNIPGHKHSIIFLSLMTYLLITNLMGLLPYTFTPTTQLAMNMGFALPLWLTTVLIGLRNQMTAALGHLLPLGTPTPLVPILIIIETVSLFIRPLALGVRLTANLTAGHLLMQLVSTAVLILLPLIPIMAVTTFIILLLLTVLEIAVAMIQAYVFMLLVSLYLQENV